MDNRIIGDRMRIRREQEFQATKLNERNQDRSFQLGAGFRVEIEPRYRIGRRDLWITG